MLLQKSWWLNLKFLFFVVDDSLHALGEVVRYIRKKRNPYVYGITGSVGKTTTKEMLSFLLSGRYRVLKSRDTENNFLGVSKTFLSLTNENVAVLELGTNSPGEIESLSRLCVPDIGIITFIKPVHLEGLGSLSGVFKEKTALLRLNPKIKAVLNADDPYLKKVNFKGKIYWFGQSRRNDLYFRLHKQDSKNSVFLVQNKFELVLPTQFCGFIANAMAALAGSHILRGELKDDVNKLNEFKGFAPLRMQAQDIGRFFVINDSYNANPYSFEGALKVIEKYSLPKIAVVGDMLELGKRSVYYHQNLALMIIKAKFDCCLAVGSFSRSLVQRLRQLGYKGAYHFSSHKDVAQFIKKRTKKRYLIFIKGSRKMELEKVLNYL
ncbi:MAG: Mur ligase family protein [Candidatus Omnitrophota bacterium]